MKTQFQILSTFALLTTLSVWAQDNGTPFPTPKTPPALSSRDAKEKDEDTVLLQQLEVDAQKSRGESKANRARTPMKGGMVGAGLGVGPMPQPGVSYRVENLLTRPAPGSHALVVRTGDADPKTQGALEEDLAVMSHILTKALDELPGGAGNGHKVMGIDVFFTSGATPLRSLYLDNYGAVFFLNVNFPLVAPPEKHTEEKQVGDSAWEDARQELYGQHQAGGAPGEPGEEYNPEKVDKLKDALLESLKNASNIRGLKPNEFLTIWVSGGANSGEGRLRVVQANAPGNVITTEPMAPSGRKTILTLRVTKAQIDSYASGKLPAEDFQKQARITVYTGETSGAGGEALPGNGFGRRARF